VDIIGINNINHKKQNKTRKAIHIFTCIVFFIIIMAIDQFGKDNSIIDTIYRLASYTYGPLLGMFIYGLFTKRAIKDKYMPWIAILSPVIIAAIDYTSRTCFDYKFGYELLMLNALLTIAGMMLISNNKNKRKI
jgi:hypothetical protein